MNDKKKTKIYWITQTAVFIALLIVSQMVTAPLGNIIVTGSIVNMLLIVSVMMCGLSSGLAVAFISPIMAKLLGIGPFWSLIPFIIVGNTVLVLTWHLLGGCDMKNKYTAYFVALAAAAIGKFAVLYIGIVKIAVPVLLKLPEKQAAVISNMFSLPQLITALIGGIVAVILLPRLKSAVQNIQK